MVGGKTADTPDPGKGLRPLHPCFSLQGSRPCASTYCFLYQNRICFLPVKGVSVKQNVSWLMPLQVETPVEVYGGFPVRRSCSLPAPARSATSTAAIGQDCECRSRREGI